MAWILFASIFLSLPLAHAGDDPTTKFLAAWKALEAGQTAEAVTLLRANHLANPDHRPSSRLVAVQERISTTLPDPDLASIHSRVAGDWKQARSRHFLLFHQHEEREAAGRLELAEQVFTTFYLWFTGLGLDLKIPDHRLVSIWYAKRADYRSALTLEGSDSFANTHGHYSPLADIVSIADERDDDDMADRTDDRSLRKSREIATLAHETVHQLVARSGLEKPGAEWPRWLQEGVAMLFEPSQNGQWAGVGQINDHRYPIYRAIRPAPRLLSTVKDLGFGPRYDPNRYAAAWSLVDYLARSHTRRFVSLLDRLRTPEPEPISPGDRAANAFREVFGDDWPQLEISWHRAMRDACEFPLNSAHSERR